MGIQDSFQGASMIAKIAFGLLLGANFLNWMCFTTSYWAVTDPAATYFGIWRQCSALSCSMLDGIALEWFNAFQAFAIFGFVLINVSFALVIFFIFLNKCKGDKEVGLATAITGIAAAVMWLIAVIVFGAEYDDWGKINLGNLDLDLDFSFGLAIIALILSAVGGVAMIFEKGGSQTKPSG